ncbi:glycosyltransferase family 4 protein [Mongoliitalea daihaiensis]|uniref:glycosyltransferase family 4 protein n=1 Tax=Mongoliitalea daihaiensis TaxID=2782006 RepID=UPI001F35AB4F|nr:glycosyltransferase family 4 protein [Mongoliitalea daihaiensis]UJP64163.1 glycosyltransferase family 4 protein [Mongoliitalea daihaiensis]
MKILQLIQKPQRRGAEIFAAQLATNLQAIGHQVLLVSIFEGEADLPFSGECIQLKRPIKRRLYDWSGWRDLTKIIKDFQPDIVQANAADTLKFAVFSKLFFRWKTPIVYRNANQMGDFIRNSFHHVFNQFLLNRIQGIASVSRASLRDLNRTFKTPTIPHQVIPIGIDLQELQDKLNQSVDVKLKKPFLLQLGGLVPEKSPIGMLEIVHTLQDTSFDLVFMGNGPLKAALELKAQELNLADRIHFLPNQPNPFPILTQAKAVVMPSKIEGLPAVILEAMALQIPVIAYGVGGIPEVLNEQTGYCIPPGDSQAFVQAIHACLYSDNTSKLNNAQKLVLENYTLAKVAKQFEDFYRELLSRKPLNARK